MKTGESPHTVTTLKELMDERDLRYEQRFKAQEEALKLAKGQMPIVTVISVLALSITILQLIR